MRKYKHIFFDLDRTLWDFNRNSEETINDLLTQYDLHNQLSSKDFIVHFFEVNELLWAKFRIGEVDKEQLRKERFVKAFQQCGIDNEKLSGEIAKAYLELCPIKTHLKEGCHEVLRKLKESYHLHILTNGFRESQIRKLDACQLSPYFNSVLISGDLGFKKPHREIFIKAMESVSAKPQDSLMVGDDLVVDILGAARVGMDQVHYQSSKDSNDNKLQPTYTISNLNELLAIL